VSCEEPTDRGAISGDIGLCTSPSPGACPLTQDITGASQRLLISPLGVSTAPRSLPLTPENSALLRNPGPFIGYFG
jgi:hypothetical protein